MLDHGLARFVTVYSYEGNVAPDGSARSNTNQADEATLEIQLGFSGALARGVISQRGRNEFGSLLDLLEIQPEQSDGNEENEDDSQAGSVNRVDLNWLAVNLE